MSRRRINKGRKREASGWENLKKAGNNDPNFQKIVIPTKYEVKQWCVKVGEQIALDQDIAILVEKNSDRTPKPVVPLSSPYDGTMLEILKDSTSNGEQEFKIGSLSYCPHDIIDENLCAVCGRQVDPFRQSSSGNKLIINVNGGKRLKVSKNEAESNRERTVGRLFDSRKLSLILDLDHTLIHATSDSQAAAFIERKKANDAYPFSLSIPDHNEDAKMCTSYHFVKLRPTLRRWLQDMSRLFELHIYTAGTRIYAEAIAKIIDPDGSLFQDRIVSRTDVPDIEGSREKSLKRIFPVDDSMVIIIDDRADVWKNDFSNLITIKPYHFFIGMAEENNASGPEFQSQNQEDTYLKHVGGLLQWVHERFYKPKNLGSKTASERKKDQLDRNGMDVKVLLKTLKGRILRFVRLFIDPETGSQYESLQRKAQRLGATVCMRLEDNPSHVISRSMKSAVAVQARKRRIWALNPQWLLACEHNWTKEREAIFSLFPVYQQSSKRSEAMKMPNTPESEAEEAPKSLEPVNSGGIDLREEKETQIKAMESQDLESNDNNAGKATQEPVLDKIKSLDASTQENSLEDKNASDSDDESDFAADLEAELLQQ